MNMKPPIPQHRETFYVAFALLLTIILWLSILSRENLLAVVFVVIIGGLVIWRILEIKKVSEFQRKQRGVKGSSEST